VRRTLHAHADYGAARSLDGLGRKRSDGTKTALDPTENERTREVLSASFDATRTEWARRAITLSTRRSGRPTRPHVLYVSVGEDSSPARSRVATTD